MKSIPSIIQYMTILILSYSTIEISTYNTLSDYKWTQMENWSQCSTSCGTGSQRNEIACVKIDLLSESIVANDLCQSLPKPKEKVRNCYMNKCEREYYWKFSKWSECSQTCGNAGRRSRDVECVFNEGNGNTVTNNDQYCTSIARPDTISSCNLVDCPPVFITGNWRKCIKSSGCQPGKQTRSLDCITLLKSGKTKKVSKSFCYKRFLPPSSWRKCFDHINTKECLKSNQQLPEIETKKSILVQMRKTKKFKIQIGQKAYVLFYTRILLKCPVNYFVPEDIVWKHNGVQYKFNREDSKKPIKVDKKGRLRILKFKAADEGLWVCFAGSINASTIIRSRTSSSGYKDWILRKTLWNKEMLKEDLETGIVRKEVTQWILGAWTTCSLTCGGQGLQYRQVHCEEIDTRHYTILDDNTCQKRGRNKPVTKRKCTRNSECPKWIVTDLERFECTEECLHIGVGKMAGNLSCIFQEKEIDSSLCHEDEMPSMDCPNENCQVAWKISKWSKCSLSCGGVGIMARYLMCVWKNTKKPAGSLCYQQRIFVPRIIKTCSAPRCNLKCVDLSNHCDRKERFCKLALYSYICCSTCKKAYLKYKVKYVESESVKKMSQTNVEEQVLINETKSKEETNLLYIPKPKMQKEVNESMTNESINNTIFFVY